MQKKTKDLLCMGISKKVMNGPNPLSIKKKVIRKIKVKVVKRRLRKGIRSKLASEDLPVKKTTAAVAVI